MIRVLVTDAHHRKALAAIRNLGHHGIWVVGGDEDRWAMSRWSKYCKEYLQYPSPKRDPETFIAFISNYLRDHPVDVILPMNDETVISFARYNYRFEGLARIPVPPLDVVMLARDKALTLKLAAELGVPAPKTEYPEDPREVEHLAAGFRYPVVIKPRESSGSRGIIYVQEPGELVPNYIKVHAVYPKPLIQEYIPKGGGKYHVGVLMDNHGQVKAKFTQKVLREFPVSGGVGTLWQSDAQLQLEQWTIDLLRRMNWGPGVALAEYLIHPETGKAFLMEVNPRFWGTLQGSISSGVEFPYLLTLVALGVPFDPVLQYRHGMYCQWLLPGDILNFLTNRRRWKEKPGYLPWWGEPRVDAIISDEDLGPVFGFFVEAAAHLFDRQRWKHVFRKL